MIALQEFVNRIQSQDFFDSENGNIINITLVRDFFDESGKVLARKYAYLRVFESASKHIDRAQCRTYWVLPESLTFALDGKEFFPERDIDSISDNCGLDWERILSVEKHRDIVKGKESCVFIKIEMEPNIPF